MRIPRDISLASYIKALMKVNKLYSFYKTKEWHELKNDLMEEFHNECELCKEKAPAVYSRAVTIHHVNEVKKRPDLALDKWYRDPTTGKQKRQLIPLCGKCHNAEHDRFSPAEARTQLNEERW